MLESLRNKGKRLALYIRKKAGLNTQVSQSLSSISLLRRIKVALFSALAIWIVAYSSLLIGNQYGGFILLASMGASAVLLFGLPNSPLAQPWSFVGGHTISAAIGVTCAHFLHDMALLASVTIGITLLCMYTFECIHPPGGATALVPVFAAYEQPLGYEFLLYPVATGVLTLLTLSFIYRRWVLKEPVMQSSGNRDPRHVSENPPPLNRLGLQADDFLSALNSANKIMDISEQDLKTLYHSAQAFAYERSHETLTCAMFMSKKIITVTPTAPLASAWNLLRKHKVSSLPVLENDKLVGVISNVDFLKHIQVEHYAGFFKQLNQLLFERNGHLGKKRFVSELMVKAPNIVTVKNTDHLAKVIPLITDGGFHHLPIVDDEQHLLGILTQSDVIAALYNQQSLSS